MNTLIIIALLVVFLYKNYERMVGLRMHRSIPIGLRDDSIIINSQVIPDNLTWAIPSDYELREDWKMSSHIEPIFVDGMKTPMWSLNIELTDDMSSSSLKVVYDLEGKIHEY